VKRNLFQLRSEELRIRRLVQWLASLTEDDFYLFKDRSLVRVASKLNNKAQDSGLHSEVRYEFQHELESD
jgi:hypothetical protein